jgi:glutaconyl-CoA decarboxylase
LGQSLIYSIQQTDVPMMLVVLRKGTAAAHYVMGGPTANRHNAFTLGTPPLRSMSCTAKRRPQPVSRAGWSKEKDAGRPLEPVIEK